MRGIFQKWVFKRDYVISNNLTDRQSSMMFQLLKIAIKTIYKSILPYLHRLFYSRISSAHPWIWRNNLPGPAGTIISMFGNKYCVFDLGRPNATLHWFDCVKWLKFTWCYIPPSAIRIKGDVRAPNYRYRF